MTNQQIHQLVGSLDEAQLRELNKVAVDRIKALTAARDAQAKMSLFVGCQVRVTRGGKRLPGGITGTVTKLGRGRVGCDFGNWGHNWVVPASMLELVGSGFDADSLIAEITGSA